MKAEIKETLLLKALEFGATYSAFFNTTALNFLPDVRFSCELNTCGKYGKNWMCPPGVGPIDELEKRAKAFEEGVVMQFIVQLEDSFDYENMMKGMEDFYVVFRKLIDFARETYKDTEIMPLGAGGCKICEICTYETNEPCRHPEQTISSLEANGIMVNDMLTACGLKYNNGLNTVSYAGAILVK